jgi:hypothetical protein
MIAEPAAETNPVWQRQRSVDRLQPSQYVRALTAANEFLDPDRQAELILAISPSESRVNAVSNSSTSDT